MLNQKGLTFIEIMLTISIAALIAAMGFSGFYQWRNHISLLNQVDELKSNIVKVRQLAIAAAGEKKWGIRLEDAQYIIFNSDSYDQSNPNNETILLKSALIYESETSLSNGNGAYSLDLIFEKFTGQTINIGTITLVSLNNPEVRYSFSVDNLGNIN